ncbi:MAG: PilZ domain-containing protein [Candidatus Omnitrophota bacterium]|nr:PilZ domain-containing protein [Candidatus Omnitrophota bacterium]
MSDQLERRKYPRAKADISLKIARTGEIVQSKIHDISCSGIHCQLNQPIKLMTKVVIILLLPRIAGEKIDDFDKIKGQGVVVRIQEVAERDEILYNTAVFFTDLSKKDKDKITRFVEYKLSEQEKDF